MKQGRLYELDALRGIAALIVVIFHYSTQYGVIFGHAKENYQTIMGFGHYGVQLFFVISGFVIYMSLSKVSSVKDFAIKRAIRLYPAYIFAVLLTTAVASFYVLKDLQRPMLDVIFNLTMLQGFVPGVDNVDGVYWSLRVELAFYILMAMLILIKKSDKVFQFSIGWMIISVLLQVGAKLTGSSLFSAISLLAIPDFSHLFIIGVMFYLLRNNNEFKYHLMISLSIAYDFLFLSVESGLVTTLITLVFYLMVTGRIGFLKIKPLIFLGSISYSLYLVHQFLGYIIIHYMESIGMIHEVYILVPLTISIAIAYGITRYIETPIQGKLLSAYKASKTNEKPSKNKIAKAL